MRVVLYETSVCSMCFVFVVDIQSSLLQAVFQLVNQFSRFFEGNKLLVVTSFMENLKSGSSLNHDLQDNVKTRIVTRVPTAKKSAVLDAEQVKNCTGWMAPPTVPQET